MKNRPALVYADANGNVLDWPDLEMAGAVPANGNAPIRPNWFALPEGSELFLLPERLPVGYNFALRRFEPLTADPLDPAKSVRAVAAFISPAYTHLYSPAYRTMPRAPFCPFSPTRRWAG